MIAIHCLEEQQNNKEIFFTMVVKHTKMFFHIQITKQLLLDVSSGQSSSTQKKQSESVAS